MSNNITFVTHLRYDSPDRLNNLQIVIDYYGNNLPDSKFIFVEDDIEHNKSFDSIKWKKGTSFYFLKNQGIYHRTKSLNYGMKQANTPVVVSLDTDCIVPIDSIKLCESNLLDNRNTVAWPYNGYFIDTEYTLKKLFVENNFDYNIFIKNLDNKLEMPLSSIYNKCSVRCTNKEHLGTGGIVMFNRELFLEYGGYNENFIGWGCEDNEIVDRMKILQQKTFRDTELQSICFHLIHSNAQRVDNPYFIKNSKLQEHIKNMNKQELLQHILTWKNN
jgi:hypothetical protein